MIKLIGLRRVVILVFLLGLNILTAAGYFLVIDPMRSDAQQELDRAQAEVNELNAKISAITADIAFVRDNLPKYKALYDNGFFQEQDRFAIGRMLEDLRKKTGMPSFSYTVGNAEEVKGVVPADMDYDLVRSRIRADKISLPADVDVYVFLQKIAEIFPEHTRLNDFEVKRTGEVTEDNLKKISGGQDITFVDAKVSFDWITLVPKRPAAGATGASPSGGFRGR